MELLAAYAGQDLTWTPSPTTKRTYELHAGTDVLATLTQPSWWRQDRVGVAANGQWTFARAGVFRSRLVVSDATSGLEAASYTSSGWTGKGELTLPDGGRYQWSNGNVWGSKRVWLDETGQPVLRFRQYGVLRWQCVVSIERHAATKPHLTLLAMLGWYLMLLANDDAAAVTATIVATST